MKQTCERCAYPRPSVTLKLDWVTLRAFIDETLLEVQQRFSDHHFWGCTSASTYQLAYDIINTLTNYRQADKHYKAFTRKYLLRQGSIAMELNIHDFLKQQYEKRNN